MKQEDDEDGVAIDGSDFEEAPLCETRTTESGRYYRAPDPDKRVIYLEEDCGLILFDAAFFQQIPGFAQTHMDEGNPIINAQWKKKNLLPFRKPWRPSYRLPK